MPTMSEAVRTMMRMDAEAAQETAAQADAGFLWDFWYPAVRSAEIRGQKLVTAMLLEVPLVLGRTSEGKAFAMRDSCPHRGIPLSYGRLDGEVVECCYHGWRFDACSGRCVEIPSLTTANQVRDRRKRFRRLRRLLFSAKNTGSSIFPASFRRMWTRESSD